MTYGCHSVMQCAHAGRPPTRNGPELRSCPRSYLGPSIELGHDLRCSGHLMTLYFHVVSSIYALLDVLKSRFFGLTPLPGPCSVARDATRAQERADLLVALLRGADPDGA